MRLFRCLLGLACCLLCLGSLSAQYRLSATTLNKVPEARMPAQDNATLLAAELAARRPGRANAFAVTLPVKIRPEQNGLWTLEGNALVWRQRISSPGAKTLNLGFGEFNLPAGAELYLVSPEERLGPFTPADNEDHNQLWTPVVRGDELLVELRVPPMAKDRVQLYLTSVNHDFEDITKLVSGECNVDVVCGSADGWPIVDRYRDIIRSVAAYTINGRNTCTGFLVNNVNQDGTPLFMTADHCGVTAGRAPSMVAYWNYQNSNCRRVTPGTGNESGGSNGRRNIFNSGSTLLATFPNTDFTLLLLDDPVVDAANAFFAGWSAEAALPQDTVVCIHHPGVQEKRISFSFQQVFRTFSRGGNDPDPNGNHLEVPDWDIGTTEGGSSGSPIFDRFGRVRGQLFGGDAACNNDFYDVYGFFHSSWTGGGTPDSRLMDWLDPCGTGQLTIDGFDAADQPTSLVADIYCRAGCNEADNRFTFTLGDGFAAGTPVMATADNGAVNPQLSATTAAGGETLTVTIPANTNLPEDRYEITVTAGRGNNVATAIFYLDLVSGSLVAPSVLSPQDAATDVSPLADLAWNPVEDAIDYEVALARDAGFTDVLTSTTAITATTLPTGVILNPETTYHWRVRARSACGNSPWATFSFTTASELCSGGTSDDTPVVITEEGNQTILASLTVSTPINLAELEVAIDVTHTFVGDLDADLRGPDGTTIRLFNTIQQGGCPNDNMSVIFRADAVNTSADFENTCTANDISVAGIFQPAESFNAFAGAATTGTWTLVLRDNAGLDAGSLDKFTITACGDVDSGSFSVTTETQRIAVCPDDPANLQLRLGGGFTSEVSLRAEANDQALDNFTFNFNTNDRLLNVDFSNWVLLASGDYNLRITLITGANAEHSIMLPLTIRERTEVATLVSPAENAAVDEGAIRFIWNTTPGVNNYTFEYSLSEDFSTVAFSEETTATELTIDNLPTGQPLYWRVRTSGECGTATSEVRSLTLSPTGVQDFGNGRTLSVYPNPVKDFLTVEAKGNWPTGVRAGLFDAAGRYVRTYTLNGSGRENWPLGNLAAGVYYLRFDGAGTRRTERLVVLP